MLQTTLMPCWLPDNHRACIKMLGNSIATPHATVGLTLALALLYDLSRVEVQELQMWALSKRMTSQNIRWERKWGGFSCDIHEEITPTLMIHSVQKVVIRSPMDVAIFHAERDVNVQDALKALLGISMPTDVHASWWKPLCQNHAATEVGSDRP